MQQVLRRPPCALQQNMATASSIAAASTVQIQNLACEIVTDQFGEIVGNVCKSLIYKGRQQLNELGRALGGFEQGYTPSVLKNSILVLIQHNCVIAYREEATNNDSGLPIAPPVSYGADKDKIIQRLRHPRFLVHIREDCGERAECILQSVLENGRLRLDQMLEYVADKEKRTVEEAKGEVEETMCELINNHFLERAPTGTPAPPKCEAMRRGKGGGRGGGAAAQAREAEGAKTIQEQAKANAEKYRLPTSLQ
ncbi:hypothetical protein CYMTET_41109 [Cymbomonas tetramitiformis]|uniref:DNA-directed RNA polymerase III subunit RPC3 n=1 Tax=Cymbomonas tetramitiformis TaxID=36881 RepID=A0AAE0C7U8_9CHLO|nr:hypothetical protein CYMTET_41109 [Cymbomonas tetramitiformis]